MAKHQGDVIIADETSRRTTKLLRRHVGKYVSEFEQRLCGVTYCHRQGREAPPASTVTCRRDLSACFASIAIGRRHLFFQKERLEYVRMLFAHICIYIGLPAQGEIKRRGDVPVVGLPSLHPAVAALAVAKTTLSELLLVIVATWSTFMTTTTTTTTTTTCLKRCGWCCIS
jgi:hypothetical protein